MEKIVFQCSWFEVGKLQDYEERAKLEQSFKLINPQVDLPKLGSPPVEQQIVPVQPALNQQKTPVNRPYQPPVQPIVSISNFRYIICHISLTFRNGS